MNPRLSTESGKRALFVLLGLFALLWLLLVIVRSHSKTKETFSDADSALGADAMFGAPEIAAEEDPLAM